MLIIIAILLFILVLSTEVGRAILAILFSLAALLGGVAVILFLLAVVLAGLFG